MQKVTIIYLLIFIPSKSTGKVLVFNVEIKL